MAKAIFKLQTDEILEVDNIENLQMQPPYWMFKDPASGDRVFLSFALVSEARISGEEELIKAAQSRVNNPEELARKLGLEE